MICVPIPCFCGCSKLIGILAIIFWAWVLFDCIKNEPGGSGDRILWAIVIVLAPVFGAALYVFVRRPYRIAHYGR